MVCFLCPSSFEPFCSKHVQELSRGRSLLPAQSSLQPCSHATTCAVRKLRCSSGKTFKYVTIYMARAPGRQPLVLEQRSRGLAMSVFDSLVVPGKIRERTSSEQQHCSHRYGNIPVFLTTGTVNPMTQSDTVPIQGLSNKIYRELLLLVFLDILPGWLPSLPASPHGMRALFGCLAVLFLSLLSAPVRVLFNPPRPSESKGEYGLDFRQ